MSLVSGSHSQDSLLVLVSQSRLVSLGWSNGLDRSRPVGWSSRSIGLSLDRSVDWSVLGTLWKKKHYMIYVMREEVLFGKCIVQANMRMLRCMPISVKQHRYIIELSIENSKIFHGAFTGLRTLCKCLGQSRSWRCSQLVGQSQSFNQCWTVFIGHQVKWYCLSQSVLVRSSQLDSQSRLVDQCLVIIIFQSRLVFHSIKSQSVSLDWSDGVGRSQFVGGSSWLNYAHPARERIDAIYQHAMYRYIIMMFISREKLHKYHSTHIFHFLLINTY